MPKKVNLDALIKREDFEAEEFSSSNIPPITTISIEALEKNDFFLRFLRKPDFQRETNEWDINKIVQFIKSSIDGDLIPALILWRSSSGLNFIIDGSHRFSSLFAWINDDYGDGLISKTFYDGDIPDDQMKIADKARKVIRKEIGAYNDFKLALLNQDKKYPDIFKKRLQNIASRALQLQWVEGDVKTAEASFFKINLQAAPINPTEIKLLESRRKPNCIAARAITHAGKGHKYWAKFSEEKQMQIQEISTEINTILFSPKLETPIKTLDIPIGGNPYSSQTLSLIFDFVNITNNISIFSDFKKDLQDDDDGTKTIQFLKKTREVAQEINSIHPGSLGLHPIVYFYSKEGRHKTTSFIATIHFIMELNRMNKKKDFTDIREKFEKIIVDYDYLVQQIGRNYRKSKFSYKHVTEFYFKIIDFLKEGHNTEEVITNIVGTKDFRDLKLQIENEKDRITSSEKKSSTFIKEAFSNPIKCKICNGFIHKNSITIDHIKRKREGGSDNTDNLQLTHPYCNTTYKQ